jgi:quaternary ammonium compound-resistance protein SugE
MAWGILFLAGICEAIGAILLEYPDSLLKWFLFVVFMGGSLGLLNTSLKWIPLGTAYAIWTGMGVLGTTLYSSYIQKIPLTPLKLICLTALVSGLLGLKLLENH